MPWETALGCCRHLVKFLFSNPFLLNSENCIFGGTSAHFWIFRVLDTKVIKIIQVRPNLKPQNVVLGSSLKKNQKKISKKILFLFFFNSKKIILRQFFKSWFFAKVRQGKAWYFKLVSTKPTFSIYVLSTASKGLRSYLRKPSKKQDLQY